MRHQVFVQTILENQVVGHANPVRLHRMLNAIVMLAYCACDRSTAAFNTAGQAELGTHLQGFECPMRTVVDI